MGTQWKRRGEVISAVMGKSAVKGTDQIDITFQLLPEEENEQTDTDDVIRWFGYFTDKAIPIVVKAMATLGVDIQDYNWDFPRICEEGVLNGKEAILVLEEETYEGKTRTKVCFINDPNFVREQMDDGSALDFNKRMRAALMAAAPPKKGAAPAKAPPRKAAPAPVAAPKATGPEHVEGDDKCLCDACSPF